MVSDAVALWMDFFTGFLWDTPVIRGLEQLSAGRKSGLLFDFSVISAF